MKLTVDDEIHLSAYRTRDREALVAHLNDQGIYDRTLRIPYPYNEACADAWLALVARRPAAQSCPVHWAVRTADEALIGGCGFDDFEAGQTHRAEIGYWLARPFWGRGIMTAVVQRLCRHAFEELSLEKITAHVFTHNPASARVLVKCGFRQEGLLRKHFHKDGRFLDAWLFARFRGE